MELQNIEFNGMEYEVKGLIEFSSLARLLFELAKRQKELENKFEYINDSVLDKDQRLSDLEIKINGESRSYQKKYDGDTFSQRSKPSNYDSSKPGNYDISKDDEGSTHGNKISPEIISKLSRKIRDIEKKISEMNSKTNNDMVPKIRSNHDNIESNKNKIDELDKNYDEINKKLMKFSEEFDDMKVKVQDFNIYDIFKTEGGEGGNIDVSKALIMNLENKIFKKFSLYDEKNKKNENDLFKALEELKTLRGLIDNSKVKNQRGGDKINELEKALNDYITKNDNKLEEIINSIEQFEEKLKEGVNLNDIKNEFDEKIKKLEEELKELINNSLDSIKQNTKSSGTDPKIKIKIDELEKAIRDIKKNMGELDKSLNLNINNVNKTLDEKISSLEKELERKAFSTDLNPINDKLYSLEEYDKELTARLDALHDYNDKFRLDLLSFNKRLEFFIGDYEKFKSELEKNGINKSQETDKTNFVELAMFNDFKREINLKYEKLRMNDEDLNRTVTELQSAIDQFVTNKDFVQFQNSILGMLDELRASFARKYMEKSEFQKSIRILESQIKSLTESIKKNEGADNWLLAKKPLNNYQCASCEAMLKDLEKKDNFVAWNKYPSREDKTYRMGHGFSRMLQMVNEEIIKNLENRENKGYVSDEDKKMGNNRSKYNDSSTILADNKSIKLPKVNQKTLSNDNYGMTANKFRMNSSPYTETDLNAGDEPKVTRIYKVNNSKKNFNKTENNNKSDNAQMNMTQPNDKK